MRNGSGQAHGDHHPPLSQIPKTGRPIRDHRSRSPPRESEGSPTRAMLSGHSHRPWRGRKCASHAQQRRPQSSSVFLGGPDDREALAYGLRMAEHPGIHLHVIKFLENRTPPPDQVGINVTSDIALSDLNAGVSPGRSYQFSTQGPDQAQERKLDEAALDQVPKAESKITVEDCYVVEPFEAVVEVARNRHHDIVLVGRSRRPTPFVSRLAHRQPESRELGPFGDTLMAPDLRASVLVFQQYDPSLDSAAGGAASEAKSLARAADTTSV